jgi:phosphoribosylformimino-5-aminoimidazole carboxamide ribonucleotide (ProFAR) isomerase
VQVGGGLRNVEAVQAALDSGATRAIVGTAALGDVETLAERFGERLVVAIDVRDGVVVADGWVGETGVTPSALVRRCVDADVRRLLVTSAARDGTLGGPDTELLSSVLDSGIPVLAAGGIATLDDLVALRDLGCEGAVVGSALWSGRFALGEAIAAVAEG